MREGGGQAAPCLLAAPTTVSLPTAPAHPGDTHSPHTLARPLHAWFLTCACRHADSGTENAHRSPQASPLAALACSIPTIRSALSSRPSSDLFLLPILGFSSNPSFSL